MAGKSLSRLSKSLLDKPQLITLEKFKEISEVLENREYLKDPSLFLDGDNEISESKSSPLPMIRLEGPTTYKPTGWEAMCGGTSYVSMLDQMEQYAEQGVQKVVLWIDSAGGQAYRMMSTARKLRTIADENNIELVGYVDGQCCSAAMGLGSVCHKLISHSESEIGSVGVVISLMNNAKQLEKEGIERKFITAGASKVPFEDDGSFREGFLEDLQASVDDLYLKFVNHVAEFRSMEVQTVKDTEARVFKAEKALELGLIDTIMEEDEFWSYMGVTPKSETKVKQETSATQLSETIITEGENMSMDTELQAKLAEMQAALEAQNEQLAAYKAKEAAAKKAELEETMSGFSFVADMKEQLVTFMLSETDAEQKQLLVDVLGKADEALSSAKEEYTQELSTLQEKLTAAEEKVSEAEAKVEKTIAEFGSKQESVDEELTEVVTKKPQQLSAAERTAQLAAYVAKQAK